MTGRERILAALAHQPVDALPVWMMRQAGRYLPGYQALRARHSFMDMVSDPDLSTEITIEPVETLGVDAAIVFHDILIPLQLLGLELDFVEGSGPVLSPAIRTQEDLARLGDFTCDEHLVVTRTLRQVRQAVGSRVAVLGFAGAPLTLATYAIEGESNKDRPRFCAVLRDDPDLLISIMEKLSPVIAAYLAEQARHTDAVQLFESHANLLSAGDYEKLALPWLRRTIELFREQAPETPLLLFAQGMGNIAGCVSSLDVDGYSMDQHMSLATATDIFRAASRQAVLQGNIDPDLLCRPADEVTAYTTEFLRESSDALGHPPGAGLPKGWIVNLGHGIKPQAQPDSALALVNAVHAFTNT